MEEKTPDFSGWATVANKKCSDGRTIMPGAFKHHDQSRVPLVWQHQHNSAENVLGHAVLEHRDEGVYAYGFFNETDTGRHARGMVTNGDIKALSIWANNLTERSSQVMHGDIRELSLVLAGANPGAFIENVHIAHSEDGDILEAVIYSGEEIEKSAEEPQETPPPAAPVPNVPNPPADPEPTQLAHAENEGATMAEQNTNSEKTVKDVFDSLTDEQKDAVYFLIGTAVESAEGDDDDADADEDAAEHSALTNSPYFAHQEGPFMSRNVFEENGRFTGQTQATLSHDALQEIVSDAHKNGSFKDAILEHAATYGIENIDILFPDAKTIANTPDLLARRMEWVTQVVNGAKHSPFSRIKSIAADITAEEARAKGYVKGNLKKEEVIKLLKRVTTPTTIYKKQKLDRDDIVDITDLDVVAYLKGEMRLMLDEEIARAVLLGDGREPDDEDKIDEDHIRPIASDVDMYAHQLTIGSEATPEALVEVILRSRSFYKGTGSPKFFTTDSVLTDLLLIKDKIGRRVYETEQSLAAALRVSEIVPVEAMEDYPEIQGIIVNMIDYTIGADKGGNVSMFDDFDIDYNQYKYLIETRISGCLTKPKSAIVLRRTLGNVVTPQSPSFNSATNTITIPNIVGVVYRIDSAPVSGDVIIDETTDVEASPASGYSFPSNVTRDWVFSFSG